MGGYQFRRLRMASHIQFELKRIHMLYAFIVFGSWSTLPIPYEPERLCVQQTFAYFHINGMFVR